MRIGIITVYDSANFGSYLQAYALRTILNEMGHDVAFIKIRDRKKLKKLFLPRTINISKYIFNYKKLNLFLREIDKFEEIDITNVNKDTFDMVIIGSDECWNVNSLTFQNKYFYGINVPCDRVISYAISCGNADEEIMKKYPQLIEGINNLERVFIRDESTKEIIEKITHKKTTFTCDPTFLIDINKMSLNYELNDIGEYILIYSYGFSKKIIKYIKELARELNVKIVSAGLFNSWCDLNINCKPLEFSAIIKGAKFVITSTFHGCIFSVLNRKQCVVIKGSHKVNDVLSRLGLDKTILFDEKTGTYKEFRNILSSEQNFNKAYENILDMRNKSINLLKSQIQGEVN